MVFGLLLRIGVPLVITALLVWFLKRLDARWQKQIEEENASLPRVSLASNPGCWKIKDCSPEMKAGCPAMARLDTPCWQVLRERNGTLKQGCLGCRVFREAPVPVAG